MKSNIIMKSIDRSMFGITIRQETKTGFLNVSDLQEAHTIARVKYGWTDRRIDHVLAAKENHERIFYLLKSQGYSIKAEMSEFIEDIENKGVAKTLKSSGCYKTTGARHTKTTYCDPYLWTLIAMELNPMIYAIAVKWLSDELIINRIEAGNFCKALNKSISKFNPNGNQYMFLAKALNHIVFGKHEPKIRDTGTKTQLKELVSLEEKMAFAIDMGYINSFDELLNELRKIWNVKYAKVNTFELNK